MSPKTKVVTDDADASLSLYHLLDPETRACPYPLYHRLRERDPVHWDAYLHAWVVTRYDDVVTVLQRFSAERSPTPEQLTALGLPELNPITRSHQAAGTGCRSLHASPRGESAAAHSGNHG
jgi:cytochrome P450